MQTQKAAGPVRCNQRLLAVAETLLTCFQLEGLLTKRPKPFFDGYCKWHEQTLVVFNQYLPGLFFSFVEEQSHA